MELRDSNPGLFPISTVHYPSVKNKQMQIKTFFEADTGLWGNGPSPQHVSIQAHKTNCVHDLVTSVGVGYNEKVLLYFDENYKEYQVINGIDYGSNGERFGMKTAQNNDFLVISAPYANYDNGAIFVFDTTGDTATFVRKIDLDDGYSGNFGEYEMYLSSDNICYSCERGLESSPYRVVGVDIVSGNIVNIMSNPDEFYGFGMALSGNNQLIVVGTREQWYSGNSNSIYIYDLKSPNIESSLVAEIKESDLRQDSDYSHYFGAGDSYTSPIDYKHGLLAVSGNRYKYGEGSEGLSRVYLVKLKCYFDENGILYRSDLFD